jgi:phage-related protein
MLHAFSCPDGSFLVSEGGVSFPKKNQKKLTVQLDKRQNFSKKLQALNRNMVGSYS